MAALHPSGCGRVGRGAAALRLGDRRTQSSVIRPEMPQNCAVRRTGARVARSAGAASLIRMKPGVEILADTPGTGSLVERQGWYDVRLQMWLSRGDPIHWTEP